MGGWSVRNQPKTRPGGEVYHARVTFDLGRRLLLSSTIQPGELRRAVYDAVAKRKAFPRALADASSTARELLMRPDGEEGQVLRTVTPSPELIEALPSGLVSRL